LPAAQIVLFIGGIDKFRHDTSLPLYANVDSQ
jgi:hypothetical protein